MNITFIFSIKHLGHARPLTISVIVSSQMIMLFDVIKPSLGLSEHLFQQVGWARWLVMWGREKSTKDLVVGFPVVFSVLSLLHVFVQGPSAFSRSFSLSPC